MYSIVNVIYGLPLTDSASREIEGMGIEPEDIGFTILYHGGAEYSPGYIGVELGEYDETQDALSFRGTVLSKADNGAPVTKLVAHPTEVAKAERMIQELEPKVRAVLPELVGVYFIFSTS